MQQQQFLESTADRLELTTGGRVTGGRVTPAGVRFDLQGGDVAALAALRVHGAQIERIEQRGRLAHILMRLDAVQAVTLDGLERQLGEIPPLTAILGISADGAPLLIRLDAPSVGTICAPPAIYATMLESLRRHNARHKLAIAPATIGRGIISDRERGGYATPAVALAGDARDVGDDIIQRGPAVGCYTIARGPDGHLPVAVRVVHDLDNPPWAVARTAAEAIRFIPAEVTR